MSNAIQWKGQQAFYLSGTERDDDTLRIEGVSSKSEALLRLVLPTLCITYADMKFANDIGGIQLDWPDAEVYAPKYFDPPVEINGEKEIARLTWIRGAQKVTLGPKETVVEWWGFRSLVIPKLRIGAGKAVPVLLDVPQVTITLEQPFTARILQFADGRHVGGVQVVKRHPDWKPEPSREEYRLWVRTVDVKSRRAVPKARVTLFRWEGGRWPDEGDFVPEADWYTNEMGIVDVPGLPCKGKQMVIVEAGQYQGEKWRFRPLDGQWVRKTVLLVNR
jgi:hypothetical protein